MFLIVIQLSDWLLSPADFERNITNFMFHVSHGIAMYHRSLALSMIPIGVRDVFKTPDICFLL